MNKWANGLEQQFQKYNRGRADILINDITIVE